jgi:uncharacterized protein YjdB
VTAATLVSIAITPPSATIAVAATQQFTATGTYTDTSTQDLTNTVVWTSSDTSVATINNASPYGLATAVSAGTTTISAASGSVQSTGTITLTVTP